MPTMPSMKENAVPEALTPSENSSLEVSSKDEASLEVPAQDEPKVELETVEKTISNSLKISVPKGGIKVVATRKGFYNQLRIKTGDKFTVNSFEKLGSWMICEDKEFEKKRVELLKDKKKARK